MALRMRCIRSRIVEGRDVRPQLLRRRAIRTVLTPHPSIIMLSMHRRNFRRGIFLPSSPSMPEVAETFEPQHLQRHSRPWPP